MIFTACCAVPTPAQDDYNKVNFYVGYSNNRIDTDEDREGFVAHLNSYIYSD